MLIKVLTQRAGLGASLVRAMEGLPPGDGGQSNLGQAFSLAKSTARKGLRGMGGRGDPGTNGETAASAWAHSVWEDPREAEYSSG